MGRKNLKMSKEEDEYVETHRCNCQIGILGIPTHQMLVIYLYNSFTFPINSCWVLAPSIHLSITYLMVRVTIYYLSIVILLINLLCFSFLFIAFVFHFYCFLIYHTSFLQVQNVMFNYKHIHTYTHC